MQPKHSEYENKFNADNIDTDSFLELARALNPVRYERAEGPDVYYKQGKNILRHRWFIGEAGELTVKRRKSKASTEDRVEIDLRFAPGTAINDVTEFLLATGWSRLFTLNKDAHIFWYDDGTYKYSLAIYDVTMLGPNGKWGKKRKFLEIEVEKDSPGLTSVIAKRLLKNWRETLNKLFVIGEPLNDSLYEIYSGKKYQTYGRKTKCHTRM